MQPLRRKLLRDAMAYYQRFLDRHGNQETLEEGAADVAWRRGPDYPGVGTTDEAVTASGRAVKRYQALVAADPVPWPTGMHWPSAAFSRAWRCNRPGGLSKPASPSAMAPLRASRGSICMPRTSRCQTFC